MKKNKFDKIKEDLKQDEDGVWQSLLNLGYNEWENHKKWDYHNMIDWVEETYGPIVKLAILLGKYNQQVNNGGHDQYFFNGYADRNSGGCCGKRNNTELHNELTTLFKIYELDKLKNGREVFSILKSFQIGKIDDDYYDLEVVNGDKLDKRYYKVSDEWKSIVENFFKDTIK